MKYFKWQSVLVLSFSKIKATLINKLINTCPKYFLWALQPIQTLLCTHARAHQLTMRQKMLKITAWDCNETQAQPTHLCLDYIRSLLWTEAQLLSQSTEKNLLLPKL